MRDVFNYVPIQNISVSVTDVMGLIQVDMDGDEVISVSWAADNEAGQLRSDKFNQLVNSYITHHVPQFSPSHTEQSKINKLPKQRCPRGRKPRGNLIVQFGGKCHCHIAGCPTMFAGGFDIEACKVVGLESAAKVDVKLILYRKDGDNDYGCSHPECTPIGRLSGSLRAGVRNAVSSCMHSF